MSDDTARFLARLDDLIEFARVAPFLGHMTAYRALFQVRRAVVNRQRLNSPQLRRAHHD